LVHIVWYKRRSASRTITGYSRCSSMILHNLKVLNMPSLPNKCKTRKTRWDEKKFHTGNTSTAQEGNEVGMANREHWHNTLTCMVQPSRRWSTLRSEWLHAGISTPKRVRSALVLYVFKRNLRYTWRPFYWHLSYSYLHFALCLPSVAQLTLMHCVPFVGHTTRKNLIRGVHNLPSCGVLLYATGTTPLIQSYPWRTACTPWLSDLPVTYRKLVLH
jgi:hypothetical protein